MSAQVDVELASPRSSGRSNTSPVDAGGGVEEERYVGDYERFAIYCFDSAEDGKHNELKGLWTQDDIHRLVDGSPKNAVRLLLAQAENYDPGLGNGYAPYTKDIFNILRFTPLGSRSLDDYDLLDKAHFRRFLRVFSDERSALLHRLAIISVLDFSESPGPRQDLDGPAYGTGMVYGPVMIMVSWLACHDNRVACIY